MGKLHELLAAEPELRAAAQRELARVKALFDTGHERLIARVRKYEPLEEGGREFPTEVTNMATTVEQELREMGTAVAGWLDAIVQKEITNTVASAGVTLDEHDFFLNLPATAILALEKHLAELRKVYAAIPANDPTVRWTWDEDKGVWQSEPEIRHREEKEQVPIVLYEATKEHPAQVNLVTVQRHVGTYTSTVLSGMLSITDRRERLLRLDALLRALKEARMRANCQEASREQVGKKILDYINQG